MTTTTRKIGLNKGKQRLWIEGSILQEHGFDHGAQWVLVHPIKTQGKFNLVRIAPTDSKQYQGIRVRKVSGKAGRPVIDLTGATVANLGLEAGQAVTLICQHNRIEVIA